MHKNLSENSKLILLTALIALLVFFGACETFNKKNSDAPSHVNAVPSHLTYSDHLFVKTWPETYEDSMQLMFFIQSASGQRMNFKGHRSGNIYKFTLDIPLEHYTGTVQIGFIVNDPGMISSKLQTTVNVSSEDLAYQIKEQFHHFRQITVFKQEKQRALKILQGETKLPAPKLKKWQLRYTHYIRNSRTESSQSSVVLKGENGSSEIVIPGQIFLHAGIWEENSFRPPQSESMNLKTVTFDHPKETFCSERSFPGGAPPQPSLTLLKCL